MRSRNTIIAGVIALAVLTVATAGWYMTMRPDGKAPKRIGIIQITSAIDAFPNGMKDGMAAFGYVEGKDVVYEYENVEQNLKRAGEVAQRFVDDDVDLIFAITNPSLGTALEATKAAGKPLPIVFVGVDKPVETGLIQSFTSTGNNSTGIMGSVTENVPKQVALLRELSPKAKVIGIFGDGFVIERNLGVLSRTELYRVAPQFGFTIREYKTDVVTDDPKRLAQEFLSVTRGIRKGEIDAVFHLAGHLNPTQQFLEIALTEKLGIPHVVPTVEEVIDGGTFGYAPDLYAVGRDTAVLIDKILRGARPEDVAVEYPRHNVLWVNLNAAKRQRITIPDSILTKADKRIGEDNQP